MLTNNRSRGLLRLAIAAVAMVASLSVAWGQVLVAPGAWQTMAPAPDLRTEASVTTDGDRLYLLGGFTQLSDGSTAAALPVHAYDPASNTWSHLTDLPEGVNHAGLVYLDGALYVVGGNRGDTFSPTDRVMVYDLATDRWRDGPALPTARSALSVVVLCGRIHAIGGSISNGVDTGAHEIFHPASGVWTAAAEMPTPRNHHAAAAVGNEVIVVAGRDTASFTLTANETYSAATDSWRTGAPVPTGRSGVAAVALEGRVYLFGGEAPTGTFDAAEGYEPLTDAWVTLPPMPTARHGLGAATIDGLIYVASGGPQPGFAFSNLNERLDPHPDRDSKLPAKTGPAEACGLAR